MYDAIVIGSGFGGAMAAHRLVDAGWRVLLLERGDWVERGKSNKDPKPTLALTPYHSLESAYRAFSGAMQPDVPSVFCVGGPSVYFGGVAFRFRVADFAPGDEIVGTSGARWPCGYDELEPYYADAERLLNVSGCDADDPTRPPRSAPFPQPPPSLARASQRFAHSARELGLSPFPLPMAINFSNGNGRVPCEACRTCDTYACATESKNDVAVSIVRPLEARGVELLAGMAVTRLVAANGRVTEVHAWDRAQNRERSFKGRYVVLAAGALASPHILLASGLETLNPAGYAVGRYLTRHCAAMVIGFCNVRPDPDRVHHKQLAVLDYYFGDRDTHRHRARRIGSIQQISTPADTLMKVYMPPFFRKVPLHGFAQHLMGTLVLAEDEPHEANRVTIDPGDVDRIGLPRLCIAHRHTAGDEWRRRLIVRRAKRLLRHAGAWSFYTLEIKTFSHALGTVRMGVDPRTSPLDGDCRFRGLENLLVVDGSALPTGGAVNPSLTISAVALRAADHLVRGGAR
jgi:choline dehydrogenase-like flavoprotein